MKVIGPFLENSDYCIEETSTGFQLRMNLELAKLPFASHHIILDQPVIPEVYLLEILLESVVSFSGSGGSWKITNVKPKRLIKLSDANPCGLRADFVKGDDSQWVVKVYIDLFNVKGLVKRRGVYVFSCQFELDCHPLIGPSQFKEPVGEIEWESNWSKKEVYSFTQHPYGPLMMTKTGKYKWFASEETIAAYSYLFPHWKEGVYIEGISKPKFILPLIELDGAIQHVPFTSILWAGGGIPHNIESIRFIQSTPIDEQIVTLLQKNGDSWNLLIGYKESGLLLAEVRGMILKQYSVDVDYNKMGELPRSLDD